MITVNFFNLFFDKYGLLSLTVEQLLLDSTMSVLQSSDTLINQSVIFLVNNSIFGFGKILGVP